MGVDLFILVNCAPNLSVGRLFLNEILQFLLLVYVFGRWQVIWTLLQIS